MPATIPINKAWQQSADRAEDEYRQRRVTIDPVTRLEGHGKIEIFLDDAGEVDRAYFQVPELRGFEKFVQGRHVEEMPQITSRICGVCPMAHHMAATKALDAVYHVVPPEAARKIRELVYCAFMVEDHSLHFYYLGGPDFVLGPDASAARRNILGVIEAVGSERAKEVIRMRRQLRELITLVAGKAIHPVFGLPGGVAKRFTPEMQSQFQAAAEDAVVFATSTLRLFDETVLGRRDYLDLITSDDYTHRTFYMGLVDGANRVNFYEGKIRLVTPQAKEWKRFAAEDYASVIAEHVEPWTYAKFCYLKPLGWKGFVDGDDTSVFSVAPLARLNAADGMATPLADIEYRRFFDVLGGKPVHHTLANHWARLIEILYAAERMRELAGDNTLLNPEYRVLPTAIPTEGIGVVEAPRGTLIHHYHTDEHGIVQRANLIVATQNNAARMAMSVEKAAKGLIHRGEVPEGVLNRIEMAFRAYDPCDSCATHALPGTMPIRITVRSRQGQPLALLTRGPDGNIVSSRPL
ncbi:MAG: Ni/Fe hydrogenase subunit alpha [Candidatus Korobacteraceae bacterium]|jgi:F420-non-reducing hydrogenase large subunit